MHRLLICTLCLVTSVTIVNAQEQPPSANSPKPERASASSETQKPAVAPSAASSRTSRSTNKAIDAALAQKRSIALSLLNSLAFEARSYRDESLRARVQARVADALWQHDQENARGLFRRAWEAAEAVEAPADNKSSVPGRVSRTRGDSSGRPRTNLRSEVLRLAAGRDPVLGQEFLRRMAAAMKDSAVNVTDNTSALSETEIRERLKLASQFLEADNLQRALQFADPALVQVRTGTIRFLVSLRAKDAMAADQRFAGLLMRADADMVSDANAVSLLTTYAFTPSMYLAVSPSGIPSSNSYPALPAPDLNPALRAQYFRVAANILLRPFTQLDQSSAGRAGTYFIATRLYPLFQQHAPQLAPAISAQLAALGPEASQATANAGNRALNHGMSPVDPSADEIADELRDRLTQARTADERDRAYAFAAMRSAEDGDARAREFTDKIEDLETRNGVRSVVDYAYIRGLLRKKNVDEAVALIRKSDLKPALRSHLLTKAAEIFANTDRLRAFELLDGALADARRIDAGTPERAYALVAVLTNTIKLDRSRGVDLARETIKAANAVADFSGENGRTGWTLEGKFSVSMGTELAGPADLAESFASLAEEDFYQTVDAGKTFAGDAPRALVTLAIARAVLEEKYQR